MSGRIGKPGEGLKIATPPAAVADGVAALRLIRARASGWEIDPARVGIIGFSAGARLTLAVTTTAAPADRPAFIAPIYPPMERLAVPADAPPMFVAMATDDPLSGRAGCGLIESWVGARRPVEFHAYQRSGHGFGAGVKGTTTEGWLDGLLRWIAFNGFLKAKSEGGLRARLSRARAAQAAAFPVRIYRWRLLCGGHAAAEHRRSRGDRAAPAHPDRPVDARPVDRAVRADARDAGRARADRAGRAERQARRRQAARAASKAGIPFCLSTVSACPIAEVAAGTDAPFWFQLYMIRDRGFMRDLMAQARDAGCSALIFTVDMPVPGSRYRDYRSGLAGASGFMGSTRRAVQAMLRPAWTYDVGVRGRPHQLGNVAPVLGKNTGLEDFFAWMRNNFDPTVSWKDLEFIRESWTGPLVIKGILDARTRRRRRRWARTGSSCPTMAGVSSTAYRRPRPHCPSSRMRCATG